jgi:Xaa-Pro aminopeptidase
MTKESVAAFDKALESLQNLALTAIITLHTDIRCGAIHMVTRSLAGNNPIKPLDPPVTSPVPLADQNWVHILSTQPTTASPAILELNNDLISFHATVSSCMGHHECRFITSGLARLIDRAFVSATRFIGAMNSNGAQRLQLDVLVLQQNLKNVITDAPVVSKKSGDNNNNNNNPATPTGHHVNASNIHEVVALPRSAKFLDWFLDGADKALEYARREREEFKTMGAAQALEAGNGEPLTYEEMKVLIELCFSAALRGPGGADSREQFMAAKRGSGDALLRLSEVMWDS